MNIDMNEWMNETRWRAIAGRTVRYYCKFWYVSKFTAESRGFHCDSNAFELNNSINHRKITVLNISVYCLRYSRCLLRAERSVIFFRYDPQTSHNTPLRTQRPWLPCLHPSCVFSTTCHWCINSEHVQWSFGQVLERCGRLQLRRYHGYQ